MKPKWKKRLLWLISPFAIGVYLTTLAVKFNFDFYVQSNSDEPHALTSLMQTIHHKSVDFRLKARGPRSVSPNVALLTVDERAVATIGRWPWPREVIAKAVDEATRYGAKVLAFDMIFSEDSLNAASEVYEHLKSHQALPKEMEGLLQKQVENMDSDKALANSFATHSNNVVAGSFFFDDLGQVTWPPETEFCRDLIFKKTKAAKLWDKEEVIVSVTDPLQPYMPAGLTNFFSLVLEQRETTVRQRLGKPKSKNDEVRIEGEIHRDLHMACDTILDDFSDTIEQIWKSEVVAKENPVDFKYPTYAAWLTDFRERSIPNGIPFVDTWTMNTEKISAGVKHTGYFNAKVDSDGTIRSKRLIVRTGSTYFPALALKAYLVANNYNAAPKLDFNAATHKKEISSLEILDNETGEPATTVPVDGQGQIMINYAGPQKMFPHLSFAELLTDSSEIEVEQRVWSTRHKKWEDTSRKVRKAEFLKDKIFIVGATAVGIYDLRVTPFNENFPGAEIHLNVIDNLLQKNFFRTLNDEPVYMPFVLLAVGLLLSFVLSFFGALWGVLLTSSLLVGSVLFDRYFLFDNGIVTTLAWPVILISILYVTLTFYRYLTEERGKKELRQTFQKYVSPAIVEEILSDPKNIELGGKKVHLTVMFSDVRGFTTISERLDPRALSDLLNSYLTPMTDIVFKNRGTLDKYMGDAIMAFFGAPLPVKDHAKYACRCALQSVSKLKELQKEYEAKGLPTIDIGIGLNTGDVSAGNMGSETVRSYTVMGDAVNLASRLEGINKQYGTRIILSEFTYQEVKDAFVCREIDWVRVKGKVLPVKIYELIGEGKASGKVADMLKWFNEGYEKYHVKAWQLALENFSKCLDFQPDDEVAKLYAERCQNYLVDPPPSDWDGVFVMKTK